MRNSRTRRSRPDHPGNLADVHNHSLLAWTLAHLTRNEKPLRNKETHGGRALYDLNDVAALNTGEARQGIAKAIIFTGDFSVPDQEILMK